jgi:hypothetical protein
MFQKVLKVESKAPIKTAGFVLAFIGPCTVTAAFEIFCRNVRYFRYSKK